MRIAFLVRIAALNRRTLLLSLYEQRWHVVNYGHLADEAFWPQVDKTIRENLKEGVSVANEYVSLQSLVSLVPILNLL
jgi:hypothetical protein